MKYDFDRVVERRGTHSVKWEFVQDAGNPLRWRKKDLLFGNDGILPLWIADMDFPCPAPVVEALVARARHGIFGYTEKPPSYAGAVVRWMGRRHGWKVAPEWICATPGVVPALNLLIRTFVAPGEKVLIQPPVYYPFHSAVRNNGAKILESPLVLEGGRYFMDFDDLREKTADPLLKMAILCNPHNPVGRVWTHGELVRFGTLCRERGVLVVSDEIHGDIVHEGRRFTPFGTIDGRLSGNACICTAPSKTFNLAGLHTSNIIISDEGLRARFEKSLGRTGFLGVGPFGIAALEAAYDHGESWLEQVLAYIGGNLRFLMDFIRSGIPRIGVVAPEGTYLVWIDCRGLGMEPLRLERFWIEEAKVRVDQGSLFGKGGEGFVRMNIACPRVLLEQALGRLKRAVDKRTRLRT